MNMIFLRSPVLEVLMPFFVHLRNKVELPAEELEHSEALSAFAGKMLH